MQFGLCSYSVWVQNYSSLQWHQLVKRKSDKNRKRSKWSKEQYVYIRKCIFIYTLHYSFARCSGTYCPRISSGRVACGSTRPATLHVLCKQTFQLGLQRLKLCHIPTLDMIKHIQTTKIFFWGDELTFPILKLEIYQEFTGIRWFFKWIKSDWCSVCRS